MKAQLEAGQDIQRDIVTLTDWMAAKWVALGYCETLDKSLLPNVEKNQIVGPARPLDRPQGRLPGAVAVGLHRHRLQPQADRRRSDLGGRPLEAGVQGQGHAADRDARHARPGHAASIGIDPASCTVDDAQKACDYIQPYVDNGQIRRFTGNDYAGDLAKGNVVACMGWSGDVVQLQFDNPDLKFVVPDKGGMIWTDNMMIPTNASHPYNAHLWMNFYYQPEIAAMVEDWVNYICPVDGAKEALLAKDPSIAENPLIFPPQSTLDNVHVFKALTPEEDLQFNQSFQALIGG